MPALNSHTQCQASQANVQAWQRVCLTQRTSKTTDKQADEKEHRSDNSTFAIGMVSCLADSFVLIEKSVFRINICAEKPAHR